ncbi:MAG: hypothetical protein WCH05_06600 [Chlorobiaceae bacterium]
MAKRGRPTEDLYLKWVAGHEETIIADCRDGADNKGLAERLGCGLTTIATLVREYPQFKALVDGGKEVADKKVSSALFKRALGYEYEESSTKVTVGRDGVGQTTFVEKTKRQMAPDTTACIFWLKNRQPQLWRDVKGMELSDKDGKALFRERPLTREEVVEEGKRWGLSEEELFR